MNILTAGIGEYVISREPECLLQTFSLGTCVAIILRDPILKTTGLLHIALPDSSVIKEKGHRRPSYFADLGIPLLLKDMQRVGLFSLDCNLNAIIIGGANVNEDSNLFEIGNLNILSVKKILYNLGMDICNEDIGGEISRTVMVSVESGKVSVLSFDRSTLEMTFVN